MKKIKFLFVGLIVLVSGTASAQKVTVEDVKITANGTADMDFVIDVPQTPTNSQINFVLPEGIEVAQEDGDYLYELGSIVAKKNNMDGFDKNGKGEYVFTLLNTKNQPFQSASGTLLTVTLQAGDVKEGTYQGTITYIEIGDPDGKFAGFDDVKVPFNIVVTTADGISSISINDPNAQVYNLQGQRVDGKTAKKGVYVVNGKKVAVK